MSVIFETLQKLNRTPVDADTGGDRHRPRRNAYALKTVLMSPVTVVILALVVFGMGYGLVYGLRQVQRSARMDPVVLAAAKSPGTAAPKTAVPEKAASPEVPPPPDLGTRPATGGDAAAEPPPAAGEPVFAGPEVPPPSAEAMAALENETAAEPPAPTWAPPAVPAADAFVAQTATRPSVRGENSGLGNFQPVSGHPLEPRGEAAAWAAAGSPPSNASPWAGMQPGSAPPRYAAKPAAAGSSPAVNGYPSAETPYATIAETTAASAPAGISRGAQVAKSHTEGAAVDAQGAPSKAPPLEAIDADGFQPPKRVAIPRHTRLVNRLQAAIIAGDSRAADRLLGDFAAAKGKNHPYLIKLKAYRHLQAGDYGAAEVLLNQVLALDETDRDAQMNMVVVEANTGRVEAARRRAARLAERFPEDEGLAAMGRRLR